MAILNVLRWSGGGVYLGIEADKYVFENCKKLYGDSFFINKSFPIEGHQSKKFKIIIALSCLDEISDKKMFLDQVKKNLSKNSILYIAVRNEAFVVNKLKKIFLIKNSITHDLTSFEYKNLFTKNGFYIISCGKFYRPWNTGLNLTGAKNLIYKILSKLVRKEMSYMIYFKLKKK